MKDINNAIDSKKSGGIEGVVDTIIFVASAVIAKAMSTKIQVGGLIGAILLFLVILIPLRLIAWTISRLIGKVSKIQGYKNWLKFLGYFILTWIGIILLIVTIAPLFDKYLSSFQNEQSSGSPVVNPVVNKEIDNHLGIQIEYDFKGIKVKQPSGFVFISGNNLLGKETNPLMFGHSNIHGKPDGLYFVTDVIEDISTKNPSLFTKGIAQILATHITKGKTIDTKKIKELENSFQKQVEDQGGSIQGLNCSDKVYASITQLSFIMCRYEALQSGQPAGYRIIYSTIQNDKYIGAEVGVLYKNIDVSESKEMIDRVWTIADDLIDGITIPTQGEETSSQTSPKIPIKNTKNKIIESQLEPVTQTQPIIKDSCDIAINTLTESNSSNGGLPTSDYSYCLQLADKDWAINKQPSKPCHKLCEKYRSRQYIHDRKCAMGDPYEKCD